MKKIAVIIAVALVASMLVLAGCESKPKPAAINMNDGLWEITVTMDMPNIPPEAKRPFTSTTCLTKNDLVPKPKTEAESKCEMKNKSIVGNTVTWETACSNYTSKGTATYSGMTFTGSSETTVKRQGQPDMVMKSSMSGKNIGACPTPAPAPQK